jgi:hypothetical protein
MRANEVEVGLDGGNGHVEECALTWCCYKKGDNNLATVNNKNAGSSALLSLFSIANIVNLK